MKILLIGSGGREHALAWQLKKNPRVQLISAPGSSALAALGEIEQISPDNISGLVTLAKRKRPDLTIIGPEAPLVLGLADHLRAEGLAVFGPSSRAAQIEGSKVFAKDFMVRHNLPTANYAVFYDKEEAQQYLEGASYPLVLKADGLAQGKGVIICGKLEAALKAITELASLEAGRRILIEEYLAGEEISYFVLTDGRNIVPLPSAQDHKTIYDNDCGPNTGGMGAYCPAPLVTPTLERIILDTIIRPTVLGLATEGTPYSGLLYAGLMITLSGPKVLEFNARFGDPETQALMPLLKSDLAEICLAVAQGRLNEIEVEWENKTAATVVMSAEGYPGPYRQGDLITGLEEANSQPGVVVFEAGVERKMEGASFNSYTKGGRVLAVTAVNDDLPGAVDLAYEAVGKISWPGAHYRRDIGGKALRKSLLYDSGSD
ncbi:MAG: phosphoribosylamine--glycine ligase [Deltaproteobacteria bacterium]|jgi:phosphoribosylamine--glycine ligase|nr:phosphoribosylamine--glycine ligase [Deltaproteobacteria bacterium]